MEKKAPVCLAVNPSLASTGSPPDLKVQKQVGRGLIIQLVTLISHFTITFTCNLLHPLELVFLRSFVLIIQLAYILKAEKFADCVFQSQEICRKKCEYHKRKKSGQKGINLQKSQ